MATSGSWVDEVKGYGPAEVGRAFGLIFVDRPAPGNLSPCPACGADKRHPKRGDKRGAVGVTRDGGGWRCYECGEGGDAVALASFVLVGRVLRGGDREWADLRRACAAAGLCSADPHDSGCGSAFPPGRLRPPPRPQPAPPARPLPEEVLELWAACRPVTDDLEAVRWARSRALDPGAIEDHDLARVVPHGLEVPSWACCGGNVWSETHRLIVPLVGPDGAVVSLHARALGSAQPKSVSPAGYEARGLMMATALSRVLLASRRLEGVSEPTICVAEGVPDFLTLATEWPDSAEGVPAVLGIISGSWTPELAGRLPDGSVVVVATDPDSAGEAYLAAIVATLADRMREGRIRVKRWRPSSAEATR